MIFTNVFRWLLVAACNSLPAAVGRFALRACNRLPALPEEKGSFRTDVALCAIGLLRQGDLKTFQLWLARYPFSERWNGFFHPGLFRVSYIGGRGWTLHSITPIWRVIGKSRIPPIMRTG